MVGVGGVCCVGWGERTGGGGVGGGVVRCVRVSVVGQKGKDLVVEVEVSAEG